MNLRREIIRHAEKRMILLDDPNIGHEQKCEVAKDLYGYKPAIAWLKKHKLQLPN
jgi:hypothetical protein